MMRVRCSFRSFLPIAIFLVMGVLHCAASCNVVILGDSNCWIGGDDCSKEKGWTKWFVDEFEPSSCVSFARSGATWTHTESTREDIEENIEVIGDNNVIYNQVKRLDDAVEAGLQVSPDVVIIAAGCNDVWFSKKRPHALEISRLSPVKIALLPLNKLTSLQTAVTYDLIMLKNSFPDAKIVVVTPLQSVKFTEEQVHAASDIIDRAARSLGCEVIRLDKESVVRRAQELKAKTYTYDGVHTSVAGAQSNGHLIAGRLRQIMNINQ